MSTPFRSMKELVLNNCRIDGRFDVREQLGRGSYAQVYLARDLLASPESPHRQVVIKALNVFLQDDLDDDLERTLVENFQNEATALDRVRHPNIISRISHGTARDLSGTVFHYLVLEYMSGGDLQGLLRRQRLTLAQSLNYIEQICAGLAHAHSRGIIHRDIKPQNLLLAADPVVQSGSLPKIPTTFSTVKIADFGVARINVNDSPITRVGTNVYAPPEHSPMSAGQTGTLSPARLTPSADIYSLAKTIFTLLTGEAPRGFANKPVTGLPESVRGEEWSGELLRVLTKATAEDASERHQTVEQLWDDLFAIRQIADIKLTDSAPQPHVARGYTPIAPVKPQFEPISESSVRLNLRTDALKPIFAKPPPQRIIPQKNASAVPTFDFDREKPPMRDIFMVPPAQTRKSSRRFAVLAISVILFTGILYGTASYMRGLNVLPEIVNKFRTRTAVANTDIYLRPLPNTDNEPVGLVTKNSKVRIVKSQNNWYQVDVVEQGRVRQSQVNATRGWLNGKYLDIGAN